MNDRAPEVLLVEDNADDAEITAHALRACGVTCRLAVVRDGEQALARLRGAEAPALDPVALVLLDLKLPRIDGLEVLRRTKADPATRRTPIVVLTSSRMDSDLRSAYELGANAYVRKELDFGRFRDAVAVLARFWLEINEPPPGAAAPPENA